MYDMKDSFANLKTMISKNIYSTARIPSNHSIDGDNCKYKFAFIALKLLCMNHYFN